MAGMGPFSDGLLSGAEDRIADVEEGLISTTAPDPIMVVTRSTDAQKFDMNAGQTTICALNAAARALRSCK